MGSPRRGSVASPVCGAVCRTVSLRHIQNPDLAVGSFARDHIDAFNVEFEAPGGATGSSLDTLHVRKSRRASTIIYRVARSSIILDVRNDAGGRHIDDHGLA